MIDKPGVETTAESPPRSRRGSRPAARGGRRGDRLRVFYFGIATLWGYAMGIASLLGALSLTDQRVRSSALLLGLVVVGLGIAGAGAIVCALAYRDARRRRGR